MAYVWSKKAEEDWVARHPKERKILRKAGELVTYDGQPLQTTGEILRAFKTRGWVDTVKTKKEKTAAKNVTDEQIQQAKKKAASKVIKSTYDPEAAEMRKNRALWKDLVAIASTGYTLSKASLLLRIPVSELQEFIKKHHDRYAIPYGEIKFNPKAMPVYTPSFLQERKVS